MVTYFTEFGEWNNITSARKKAYTEICNYLHEHRYAGIVQIAVYRMSTPVDKLDGYVLNLGKDIIYQRFGATSYFLNSDGTLGKVFQYGANDKRYKLYRKYGPLKQ